MTSSMHTRACALSFLATAAALNVQSKLTTAQRAGLLLSPQPAGVRKVLPGAGAPVPRGGVESDDWWDGATLGSCVVRRFTDEMAGDRWMLWYSGRSASFDSDVVPLATGAVGLAQSTDGVVWERLAGDEAGGACLVPNEDAWWGFDTSHVGVGDVHVMSSRVIQNGLGLYWMCGTPPRHFRDTSRLVIRTRHALRRSPSRTAGSTLVATARSSPTRPPAPRHAAADTFRDTSCSAHSLPRPRTSTRATLADCCARLPLQAAACPSASR